LSTPDNQIRIHEVAPRDGLQNEPERLDTSTKLTLIQGLADAGLREIEITSFVRGSWIPQLADAEAVVRGLPRVHGVNYWALVPNRVGLERALDVGVNNIATFMSASPTHNLKNLNRTQRESLTILREVIGTARAEDLGVRSYISTVFGCPYEGEVSTTSTCELALELLDAGADQVVLGDTTGMGNPLQVQTTIRALVASGIGLDAMAVHLHDTRGTALANCIAAWQEGIRTFDSSIAGVGGCPYAPGAAGNVATEDLVQVFEAMGVHTGVNLEAAAQVGMELARAIGRDLPGRYHRFHAATATHANSQTA
jgi:hydroxymethylglutaryl-CoA lyase